MEAKVMTGFVMVIVGVGVWRGVVVVVGGVFVGNFGWVYFSFETFSRAGGRVVVQPACTLAFQF
jgi:hypothetical protein